MQILSISFYYSSSIEAMAWHQSCNKPLREAMVTQLTDINTSKGINELTQFDLFFSQMVFCFTHGILWWHIWKMCSSRVRKKRGWMYWVSWSDVYRISCLRRPWIPTKYWLVCWLWEPLNCCGAEFVLRKHENIFPFSVIFQFSLIKDEDLFTLQLISWLLMTWRCKEPGH